MNRHRYGCRLTRMGNRLRIPMRSPRFVLALEPRAHGAELLPAQKYLTVLAVLRENPERLAFPGCALRLEPEPRLRCLHS